VKGGGRRQRAWNLPPRRATGECAERGERGILNL